MQSTIVLYLRQLYPDNLLFDSRNEFLNNQRNTILSSSMSELSKDDQNSVKLTSQQQAALTTDGVSIALSAGAGCGKTFVLTERFLSYLEPGPRQVPLNQIVAITFTERAAREMRERIHTACRERLQNCPEAEVDHWLDTLRSLDTARISTIHSFCTATLRAHAVDAQIDPEFQVLDQSDIFSLQRKLVKEQFRKLLSERNPDAMRLVKEYELEKAEEHLCTLLDQRVSVQLERFLNGTVADLLACWRDCFEQLAVPAAMQQLLNSLPMQQLQVLLKKHAPAENSKMFPRWSVLSSGIPRLATEIDAASLATLLENLAKNAKVGGTGLAKDWESKELYETVRDALQAAKKKLANSLALFQYNREHAETAAEIGLATVRVLHVLLEHYQREKQASGVMDFADLLLLMRDLLRNKPDVRQQLASSIAYLMVDEFQDTDPVQTEIVEMLCGETIETGKLFFVGDAQQSIYRFRGADPIIFRQLRKAIPAEGRLPLSTNFRSRPAILDFVNCLFAGIMGDDFEPLVPFHKACAGLPPLIEFLFARDDTADKLSVDEARRMEADWIAQRILALLNDETPRVRYRSPHSKDETLRRVEPGDIVILFRKMTKIHIYEDALRDAGLSHHLIGGRTFYSQQEVNDLVNLCLLLMNPDDEVSLLGVLRSPFFSLSDDAIASLVFQAGHLRDAYKMSPPESLPSQQRQQVLHAQSVLAELFQIKDQVPIVQLLNRAIERTGYDAALLLQSMGKRKLANLQKLIDLARQFDRGSQRDLSEFVIRLRESVTLQTDEQEAATHAEQSDVIRLMTMHQSKGLEFPVVILADINSEERNQEQSAKLHAKLGPLMSLPQQANQVRKNWGRQILKAIEANENEAENLRLFYVAATRAKDLLILSATKIDEKLENPWTSLLAEKFNLQTGLPIHDPLLGTHTTSGTAPAQIPDIKVHHKRPQVAAMGQPAKMLSIPKMIEALEKSPQAAIPPLLAAPVTTESGPVFTSVSQLEASLESTAFAQEHTDPVKASLWMVTGDDATELGTLVHQALDMMNYQQPQSVDKLLEQCQRTQKKRWDERYKQQTRQLLGTFQKSELFTKLSIAQKCYREIDFLLRWPIDTSAEPTALIGGQIDCLYQSADGRWQIVDYKTGRVTQKSDPELITAYEMQLTIYALAVEQLFGEPVQSAVLCLLGESIRMLPVEIDPVRTERIVQQIDRILESIGNKKPGEFVAHRVTQ